MNNTPLEQLLALHAAAKKRMKLGIIFTAVAVGLSNLSFICMVAENLMIFLLLVSLAFFGVGIPFLISGIIRTAKANSRIATARAEEMRGEAADPVAVPQPVAETVVAQPAPVAEPQPQPATIEQSTSVQSAPTAATGEFVDIDWQSYAPLDAGVSYDPNKKYDFHRADGFVGSVPQTFVNRTFPKCPICCTTDPYWTITQHNQMSWKGNLYLFKCSKCEGIISMSMPDVTTLGNGGAGVAANPSVGLTNLLVKSTSGKEAGAVYAVIESVGHSGVTPQVQGKEFKLEQLQEMFNRM